MGKSKRKTRTVKHTYDFPMVKVIAMILVVVVVVGGTVVGFIMIVTGQIDLSALLGGGDGDNQTTTETTTTTPTGGQVATLTWEFTIKNGWAGGLADGVHVLLRDDSGTVEEGETSSGVFSTSLAYESLKTFDILVGNGSDGWVPYWYRDVQVPLFSDVLITGAKHRTSLLTYDLGTFGLTIEYGSSRTSIADAGSYNITTLGNSETFYFTGRNTEQDSGWMSSDNPIYDGQSGTQDLWSRAVLVVAFNGSEYQDVEWQNCPYQNENDGARNEYFIPLADTDIIYDLDDYGQPIYSGQRTISALLDFANVAGDTVDIVFSLVLGADVNWLQSHSGLPGSSVQWTQQTDMLINIVH